MVDKQPKKAFLKAEEIWSFSKEFRKLSFPWDFRLLAPQKLR